MARLNEAYEVLRSVERRRAYDRELAGVTTPAAAAVDDAEPEEYFPPSPGAQTATRVLTPSGPARMPWRLNNPRWRRTPM